MTNFEQLLNLLHEHEVEFVLIGGLAAIVHGSSYVTHDLDVCYARTPENIQRVVTVLQQIDAKLRDVPQDLPFILDEQSFSFATNLTFATKLGAIDFIGEVPGLGAFVQVDQSAESFDLYGHPTRVLSLGGLIRAKEAVNRPKDQVQLVELRALQEMSCDHGDS